MHEVIPHQKMKDTYRYYVCTLCAAQDINVFEHLIKPPHLLNYIYSHMDKFKGVVEEDFQKNPHYQYLMPQSLEAGFALTTEQQVPVMALLHEIAWCIIP